MSKEEIANKRDNKGRFIKGLHYNRHTEFKRGASSPRKGKKNPGWTNKTSFKGRKDLWEQNVREYQAVHRWIIKEKGQPEFCENCKKSGKGLYHWANVTGKYLRNIDDWFRLCHLCHKTFDSRKTSVRRAANLILSTHYKGKLTLLAGNGGSMEACSHWAGELIGKFEKKRRLPIAALPLSNVVTITAIANDVGYEFVFSRQLEAYGEKGGLFICITTSDVDTETGHSMNLWRALNMATNKKRMKVLVLGSTKTKRIANYANCIVRGKGEETSEIQEDHLRLIHLICRAIEKKI